VDSTVAIKINSTFSMINEELITYVVTEQSKLEANQANDISLLPFELFRKGRFSEIFFIDLPNADERKAAIKQYVSRSLHIHLSDHDLDELVLATDGFSYSDIEYAIKDVAQLTLTKGCSIITYQTILDSLMGVLPISKNNPDMVEKIRKWGLDRAVAASKKEGGKAE